MHDNYCVFFLEAVISVRALTLSKIKRGSSSGRLASTIQVDPWLLEIRLYDQSFHCDKLGMIRYKHFFAPEVGNCLCDFIYFETIF